MKKVKIHPKRRNKSKNRTEEFKQKLLKAIEGSGGIISIIASRMKKKYITMYQIIQKAPDCIHEAIELERQFIGDVAETTIVEMMQQRMDFSTASRTALSVLRSKRYKDRGYGKADEKNINVGGTDKPILIEQENIISLAKLRQIPIEVRKQLLEEAIEVAVETVED